MGFRNKSADLSNGGLQCPFIEDGMCSFTPQLTSPACKAATLGDARDGALSVPKNITMKLHGYWGHASAHQLKRPLADSEGGKSHSVNYVGEVL